MGGGPFQRYMGLSFINTRHTGRGGRDRHSGRWKSRKAAGVEGRPFTNETPDCEIDLAHELVGMASSEVLVSHFGLQA